MRDKIATVLESQQLDRPGSDSSVMSEYTALVQKSRELVAEICSHLSRPYLKHVSLSVCLSPRVILCVSCNSPVIRPIQLLAEEWAPHSTRIGRPLDSVWDIL